jgi:hypothetical protein
VCTISYQKAAKIYIYIYAHCTNNVKTEINIWNSSRKYSKYGSAGIVDMEREIESTHPDTEGDLKRGS